MARARNLSLAPRRQVADLADIFTGRLISEIPQALTALCNSLAESTSLETLDLSDNAFGGRCAEPIVPFLTTNLTFQHFILNNNGMGPTGGNIIAAALLKAAENAAAKGHASNLRTFVCGRNRLENGTSELLSEALAAHGQLEVVRLPQNGIRMEGIARLSAGLAKNANLRHLDLQDNTLTLPGSRALTAALASWPALTELNLSDCLLSRKGGILLSTALLGGSNPKLETLRLQYGEMDRRTFEILAKAITAHGSALTTLELNGNVVDAEDDSVELVRAALEGHGNADALDERASACSCFRPPGSCLGCADLLGRICACFRSRRHGGGRGRGVRRRGRRGRGRVGRRGRGAETGGGCRAGGRRGQAGGGRARHVDRRDGRRARGHDGQQERMRGRARTRAVEGKAAAGRAHDGRSGPDLYPHANL